MLYVQSNLVFWIDCEKGGFMKSCFLEREASILTRMNERYNKSHEMYFRATFQTESISSNFSRDILSLARNS